MTIKRWTPENVVKMAMETIEANADMAGKYVEDEARRRLDAIVNPDTKRDVNYRHYLSKYILTHQVEREQKALLVRIGMAIGKQGQTHHGFYIETGSSTAPAQPYLRPALFQNLREVMSILTE